MVDIAPIGSGGRPAHAAQLAVDRNEINLGLPGTKLDQADIVQPPLDSAPQHFAVERQGSVEVADTKDDVVDPLNVESADRHRLSVS